MSDLVEFLRARLDEDRTWADNPECIEDPARVLREVEAKRELIKLCAAPLVEVTCPGDTERRFVPGEGPPWAAPALRMLAMPYADHPDYRNEWAPWDDKS